MTKHVLDHSKGREASSDRFAKIEADRMPRPQTQELQKRSRTSSESKRLKEYTGIERRADS